MGYWARKFECEGRVAGSVCAIIDFPFTTPSRIS